MPRSKIFSVRISPQLSEKDLETNWLEITDLEVEQVLNR